VDALASRYGTDSELEKANNQTTEGI